MMVYNFVKLNITFGGKMNKIKYFLSFTVLLIVCFCIPLNANQEESTDNVEYYRAKVIKILGEEKPEVEYSGGEVTLNLQYVEVKVLEGPFSGKTLKAEYQLNQGMDVKYNIKALKSGDKVFVYIQEDEAGGIQQVYITEIVREKYLLFLVALFIVILLLVGRSKGLKALISLIITIFAVIKVLLPAILAGYDPILVSIGICIVVICISLLIISGYNKKTLAAFLGTTGGVLFAGIIAILIGTAAKLSGLGDEESQMLMYIPHNVVFDFRGILFSGIIIGTMGATMDVGMSIASALHEIHENSPEISKLALIRSGMNIGRDTMATMANTLILAYAGGSLQLMLLLLAYQTPASEFMNWDMIVSEILRAVCGSLGIIISIPVTAITAGIIYKQSHNT